MACTSNHNTEKKKSGRDKGSGREGTEANKRDTNHLELLPEVSTGKGPKLGSEGGMIEMGARRANPSKGSNGGDTY